MKPLKSISYFGLGRWPNGPGDPRIFQKQLQAIDQNSFVLKAYITGKGTPYNLNGIYILPSGWQGGLLKRLLALPSVFLKMLRDDSEIIWIGNMELLPLAWLVKSIQPKKFIYDAMEHWPDMVRQSLHIPRIIRNLSARIVDVVEQILARKADLLITADPETMKRYHSCPRRIINYNYPIISTFNQRHSELEAQIQSLFSGKDVLIYVGSLGWERGLREMLLAMAELKTKYPNICLAILGKFQHPDWERVFYELVTELDVGNELIMLGYVPQEYLGEYLRAASIGISFLADTPKHHKNIATKQFDYMACGIPLVTTDLTPMRIYVGAVGAGILVNPEGYRGLAQGIDWLLANPVEASRMGRAGLSAIQSSWNWEIEADKLNRVIKHVFIDKPNE